MSACVRDNVMQVGTSARFLANALIYALRANIMYVGRSLRSHLQQITLNGLRANVTYLGRSMRCLANALMHVCVLTCFALVGRRFVISSISSACFARKQYLRG